MSERKLPRRDSASKSSATSFGRKPPTLSSASSEEDKFTMTAPPRVSGAGICYGGGLSDDDDKLEGKEIATPPPSSGGTSLGDLELARLKKYERFLDKEDFEMRDLRSLSWNGVPRKKRPEVWLVLLGILPTKKSRRETAWVKRRKEYTSFLSSYFEEDSADITSAMRKMSSQIKKDIPRTMPSIPLFKKEKVQKSLERLLFIWALRNPAAGYVQGINDLATPFYIVFLTQFIGETEDPLDYPVETLSDETLLHIEADSFWCLSKVLAGIQENYIFAQPGIQKMLFQLEELVQRIDEPLHAHLKEQGLQFLQFAFRWMNCFLLRELPLLLAIRVFDSYLSEVDEDAFGFKSFHVYVCAAFLVQFSPKLRDLEFQDLVLFIQHLPTERWSEKDISTILSQAYVYQSLFSGSPSHLK